MADRLDAGLAALNRVPVPVTWQDVEARPAHGHDDATELELDPGRPDDRAGSRWRPSQGRVLLLAVAAAAAVVVAAVIVVSSNEQASRPVDTGPGETTSTTPVGSTTTLPAVGTVWNAPVTAWTGTEYLVWSGEVGDDSHQRADGWRYDPATGAVRDIPVAPIAPRFAAAGVWTGSELLVCCGVPSLGPDPANVAASAAAFNPSTNEWRQLTAPPTAAGGYTFGEAWTGTEMLVLVDLVDPERPDPAVSGPALFAYDPATYRWASRATPPVGHWDSDSAWTGDRLVIWTTDAHGAVYDPTVDRWTVLPDIPAAHSINRGSLASVGDELVVWGLDRADETRTVGYRLRLGDQTWRPMAAAPIPPIDAYEGTAGSQTVLVDRDRGRLVIIPVTGYERAGGGTTTPPPTWLTYDPATDRWIDLGVVVQGHSADTVIGTSVLATDRANPEALRLPG